MTYADLSSAARRSNARRLAVAALVLAGVGSALGLPHAPAGPTLVFVVATLAAIGTRAGLVLGALTLLAGLATLPEPQPSLLLPAFGMGFAGLGLGLLARELDRLARELHSALLGGAVWIALSAATLALPAGQVRLADPDGAPLMLPALIVDGGSFMRIATEIPAVMTVPTPGGGLWAIALTAALCAGLILLIVHLRGGDATPHERRAAWELATLAAALTLVVALLGLGQLVASSVPIERELVRQALDLAGSRDGSVLELVAPTSAELRWWSRPWVDGLRLLAALALLALAIGELRSRPGSPRSNPEGVLALTPLVPVAMAATAFGAAMLAANQGLRGASLALLAGLVLGLGALVAAHLWTRSRVAPGPALGPLFGLAGCALVWVYAWLVTPLFGA